MARWNFAFFDSGVRWDSPDAHPTTMRTLASFLENPFDDDGISMAELIAFTTDHLQRMSANNAGGELSTRIAATTSSIAVVEDCVTDDQGRLGARMARKQAKDDFREQIPTEVKRIIGNTAKKLWLTRSPVCFMLPHALPATKPRFIRDGFGEALC